MIQDVFLDHSTWAELPQKFEAGTPAIAESIAMGFAIQYLEELGFDNIQKWERNLINYLFDKLLSVQGLRTLGPPPDKQPHRGALATFTVEGLHSNDIAGMLDLAGICIRSGHHCCQPLHRYYSLTSTARASLSFTTTIQEIDQFIEELISVISFLRKNS